MYESEVRRKANIEKLFMRTKDQHEKEKLLTLDMRKNERNMKKEEKEEIFLRKLIWDDTDFL